MRPPPAFQCYASNIITDKRYRLMTSIERAVWVSIYFECWPNRTVPADPVELARYLHFSEEDVKTGLTVRVLSFFEEVKEELICPELEDYREKLRIQNLKKSEGGKKGAERKRNLVSTSINNVKGIPSAPEGTPAGSLIQSKPKQNNKTQSIKNNNHACDPFIKDMEANEKDHQWP